MSKKQYPPPKDASSQSTKVKLNQTIPETTPFNQEQDKKGPQAIFIGFEDQPKGGDLFSKKPQLKNREGEKLYKDPMLRSKSSKGVPTTAPANIARVAAANINKIKSPAKVEVKTVSIDRQIKSPTQKAADAPRESLFSQLITSPLKKAVSHLLSQKENNT
jgi:hypothetical protein